MSDSYYYSHYDSVYDIQQIMSEENKGIKSGKKLKLVKLLALILFIVLLIEGLLWIALSANGSHVTISYSGLNTLEDVSLSRNLLLNCGSNWFTFDTAAAVSLIASDSAVESVSVEKKFPSSIIVNVKERVAAAVTLATVNGKTVPVQIDKNGVFFAVDKAIPNVSLPLLTGFNFENITDSMRIHSKYRTLIDQLSKIQSANPAYFAAISEIQIIEKEYGNFELALYPMQSQIKVLTDRNITEESLQYMMVVLDVVNAMDSNVAEVDLRYGSISYKISEQS